jgi:activator of HSP90 ATPase
MDVKTIRHSMILPTTPHEVYEVFLDSAKHQAFSGKPAKISRDIGVESTAYGGHLVFRNLELVPDKKIVQSWQPANKEWPREHFSTVKYELEKIPEGTRLNFTQDSVPAELYEHYIQGWNENYWKRLETYFRGPK